MNRIQHLSRNATLNSVDLIDTISGNLFGYAMDGHRAKRYSFSDYMQGGEIEANGYSWMQGKQSPRFGEWSKMMIKGRGFFSVQNPKNGEVYQTRLGDFHLDASGNLVTKEGFAVQGIPLIGTATRLNSQHPADMEFRTHNPNFADPFNNPYTNNAQELNPAGAAVAPVQAVNLGLDRRNGKYLGQFDEVRVGEDGVIYGRDGNNMVSLYKLSLVTFNNNNGLKDMKDGIYFKATDKSGLPSNTSSAIVIGEAIEKSNTWMKIETHNLTDAQRYYQAATQVHKLADKISGTAIEMIQ